MKSYGPTSRFTMDKGDVLVILTDGYFEWARPPTIALRHRAAAESPIDRRQRAREQRSTPSTASSAGSPRVPPSRMT